VKDSKVSTGQMHLIFWPIAILGLALDLWTKDLAFTRIPRAGAIQVIPGLLQLRTALNDGAAFSIASGRYWLLVGIGAVALIGILLWFFLANGHTRLMTIGLALVTGGVAGNLYDRLFNNGLVRDFIDLYIGNWHWPTFNIADTLLCIGVSCWLLAGLVKDVVGNKDRGVCSNT